jgi:hypothetical protein
MFTATLDDSYTVMEHEMVFSVISFLLQLVSFIIPF